MEVTNGIFNGGNWKTIFEVRLKQKKELLKYTKHFKKRESLLKEIKWLEETNTYKGVF